jgi:hypothetical protein
MRDSQRNMALEFDQGTVDRTYIQFAPDRGGLVEMDWPMARALHYAWPQYVNVGVRGPGPFDQSRLHVTASRIQEPVSTQPIHRRWPI